MIKIISWVCILAAAVAVFAMVVVMSVMNGFNKAIHKRLLASEPHLTVQQTTHSLQDLESLEVFLNQKPSIHSEIIETQDVIIRTSDQTYSGAIAKGVSQKAIENLGKIEKLDKNIFNKESLQLKPNEVALGAELAEGLKIFEGDEIIVVPPETLLMPNTEAPTYEKLTIKKIIRTNVNEIDSTHLFYQRGQTFRKFLDSSSRLLNLEVRLEQDDMLDEILSLIRQKGFLTESWLEKNSNLLYALKLEKTTMGTFLSLTILIACSSVITALSLLITHKRRDLGLFMSLGLSPTGTVHLFSKIGSLLSSIGAIMGSVLGIIFCYILDHMTMIRLPDIYYDSHIPVSVNYYFVLMICVVSILASTLGSWIPSKMISKLLPSEALKAKASV